MREIKFRAWDNGLSSDENTPRMTECKTFDAWIKDAGFYYVNGYTAKLSDFDWQNELVFMQFTGMLDKNNKEIYEGDILQIELDWGYGPAKINSEVYFSSNGCFKSKAFHSHEDIPLYEMPYLEVVGNIYENPELLKDYGDE